MSVPYQLEHSIIEAAAPVEVGHKTGQFWFPTLHQIGTSTLICAVVRGDDTAQGQWPGELYVSEDAGLAWREDLTIESYGHASVRYDESTTLMMPYEFWPASPGSKTDCIAPGTLLTKSSDGSLEAAARDVRFLGFPSLAPYHNNVLSLLHSGNLLHLKGEKWETLHLGAHHNECTEFEGHRFPDMFCSAESDGNPAISTTYTGIMPWKSDGLIVTYDRLANGWSSAPGPNGDFNRVFSVVLKISITDMESTP